MQDLQDLEKLEIEVLELLNSIKMLDSLYFGGDTMLRLCHNLNRYSTDLDFWVLPSADIKLLYITIKSSLQDKYKLTDAANKKHTMLFEFRSSSITRNLKIEIRKEQIDFDWERKIAFSKFTNKQVTVKGFTLDQMMENKTEALLSRKLIRDCFDMEFLLMRGTTLTSDKSKLEPMLKILDGFKDNDFKVILGSVLEENERSDVIQNRFSFLKEEIRRKINLL